ncbi:hypothetical protein [Desulfovibrio inopinatus]|uniref:hypothetical protein n=1 Tax=Desulfovibrio inopinatus TaxID=102109 RepID=UPI00041CF524|nr:hypothetical protein [Desulfovibrio inopinatus]
MSKTYQLNLAAIEESLRQTQKGFSHINDSLAMRREPIADIIIDNMLLGYSYVNDLLKNKINIVSESNKGQLLELNQIVLCGCDDRVRYEFSEHMRQTAIRFYNQEDCNIDHIVKWNKKNKSKSPWRRAASTYVYMISRPQLFFEGNHRTGALMMSNVLALEGYPPFVLSINNAKAYFDPSTLAKLTHKSLFTTLYKLPKITKHFAQFLEDQAESRYLNKVKT